jgi:peptidyl-prolyl cis-trans isomerase B (cyclophilin B)
MKTRLLSLAVALLAAAGSTHAADKSPAAPTADAADLAAVIKTTDGTMVAEFWPKEAPATVANFIKLAKAGFYNGTAFHRIIPDFMIQGGDPLTKDPANEDRFGTGGPGYTIKAEFNDHKHVRGVLSMARTSDPDSAGSQFFIMLGATPQLDHQYTVFGHLIKGDDVLTKIAATPTTMSPSGEPSKPTQRVEIKSITIVPMKDVVGH